MSDQPPPSKVEGLGSFGIKDLLTLLEKVPRWARIPDRVDSMERRIAALEQKPNLPICEKCGIGFLRLDRTEAPDGPFAVFEGAGMQIKVFKCDKCGMEIRKASDE